MHVLLTKTISKSPRTTCRQQLLEKLRKEQDLEILVNFIR